ncbi:amidohydrolase family protein [Dethiosulfatarculus sandiegensis]|uniref:amidohydrolase family protein n=1 Tax=Dethiosulfatarculus sandiegensis TaxID=1429043 RepID=UPI0009EA6D5E|nr:amidohydrolase family protein [Dethiosulfatarculus sandiegensis]
MTTDKQAILIKAKGLVGVEPDVESPHVLIENGVIKALGKEAQACPAEEVDLSDLYLSPAALDAHVHLWLKGPPEKSLAAYQEAAVAGVRDMGRTKKAADKTYEKPQDGPLVLEARMGLGAKGEAKYWLAQEFKGADEFYKAALKQARDGADLIKVFVTGLLDFDNPGQVEHPLAVTEKEMKAAVEAAKTHGLRVSVHASGKAAVDAALNAGVGSVEHGFFMGSENLARMANEGVYWSPTLAACKVHADDPEGRHPEQIRENIGKIVKSQVDALREGEKLGVPLVLGSDAGSYGVPHGKALFMEIEAWLWAGIAAKTVFEAATKTAALAMGRADELGVIKKGALARLVGCGASPLEDPTELSRPMWRSF